MTEERQGAQLPASVVREDQQLEVSVESASEALAKLRWHWTLDETNPEQVSFGAYAKAVGKKSGGSIRQYATGYVLFTQSELKCSFAEALQRALLSQERQVAVEAVAEAEGIAFTTARVSHTPAARAVHAAVEDEAERRETQGRSFDADERADYAKRLAEMKKRTREREEREEEERRNRHDWQFQEGFAFASHIRRKAKELLAAVREVEFTTEEREILEEELEQTIATVRLAQSAVSGESGTDWDAELQRLEMDR